MRFKLTESDGNYHIYSIARSEDTEEKLKNQHLPYWRVQDGKMTDAQTGREVFIWNPKPDLFSRLHDFDVIEVFPDGIASRYYDDSSGDNVLFITEKCNSNCIMCPSPDGSRRNGSSMTAERLIRLAEFIPSDAAHFTITGGEPFMIGEQIFDFLAYLREKFTDTDFLFLTNGRALAIPSFYERLKTTLPEYTMFGIPMHASEAGLHDRITRSRGSFAQTVTGIRNLLSLGIEVEIRIVVSRWNARDLRDLAEFIVREFPGTDHISIMAMEMTGNAYVNREQVWMPYTKLFPFVKEAADVLIEHAMDVRLYNFPLCTVSPEYWTLCRKSISAWKIRYGKECMHCRMKDACGGVFSGTVFLEKDEIKAVL